MTIKSINVKSLSQYINAIETINGNFSCNSTDVWYRGLSDDKYHLVPGVVWRKIDLDTHCSMVVDFITKGILYDEGLSSLTGYDAYAIMQHFGLPTRLLDWTFSPLVALFFALEKEEIRNKRVVWAINPLKLNKIKVNFEWYLYPHDEYCKNHYDLDKYLPDTFGNITGELLDGPIAIQVQPKNKRIRSQSGCFTIHGTSKDRIDKVYVENNCDEITKICINGEDTRSLMLESLRGLGVTEDTIYQDLSSLSKRILREYNISTNGNEIAIKK